MNNLKKADLKDKIVFLRVDLNVPVKDGKILDVTRIEKIIPTIKFLLSQDTRIIVASHFGRPKGEYNEKYSLQFLTEKLQSLLQKKILFSNIEDFSKELFTEARIILLENLRFYPGEENNSEEFAKSLAKISDLYVNDAFSCSHRAHASIDKIAKILPSYPGLLLEQELENLARYLLHPQKPMMAIIGGSKVSTKLELLEELSKKVDCLVIGGAMANTFLKAKEYNIGASFFEADFVLKAQAIMNNAKCKIILPLDVIVTDSISSNGKAIIKNLNEILNSDLIVDLGPATLNLIKDDIKNNSTIILNGPVGVFEYEQFSHGTREIVQLTAKLTVKGKLVSVAGGGDIIAAITQSKVFENFSYISTAGGAFLEWLEGKKLPGLLALENSQI